MTLSALRRARPSRVPLLLALGVPLVAATMAWQAAERAVRWIERPPAGAPEGEVPFEVLRGDGASRIGRGLEQAGVVAPVRAFRLYLALTGQSARLQAGEYLFEGPLPPWRVAEILATGRVVLHPVTVPEGLDLFETAEIIARTGRFDEEELLAAFRDPALIADLDPDAPDLEGYLFPETYLLPRTASTHDLVAAMVLGFRREWASLGGPERARLLDLPIRALATLASLVEEETSVAAELPLVAAVYHRRVRLGMKLQCDPTVIAGLKREGLWPGGELTRSQLAYPSPYNTYLVPGLPPGPIASFGRAALAAALGPADVDHLFFVATGDGGHRFARTNDEHEANVRLWRAHQREAGLR